MYPLYHAEGSWQGFVSKTSFPQHPYSLKQFSSLAPTAPIWLGFMGSTDCLMNPAFLCENGQRIRVIQEERIQLEELGEKTQPFLLLA